MGGSEAREAMAVLGAAGCLRLAVEEAPQEEERPERRYLWHPGGREEKRRWRRTRSTYHPIKKPRGWRVSSKLSVLFVRVLIGASRPGGDPGTEGNFYWWETQVRQKETREKGKLRAAKRTKGIYRITRSTRSIPV